MASIAHWEYEFAKEGANFDHIPYLPSKRIYLKCAPKLKMK
jgi:hypothetical protein